MTDVTIVGARDLDLDEYVDLQVATFRAHLEKYQIQPDFMNSGLYAWKYSPPAGPGKLAVAREGGALLAAVAVLPLWIGSDGDRCVLWRAVDIATRPEARGKGLFAKLLSALGEDLAHDEVLGSFPNANSTPGFKKIGAEDAGEAPTWARLVLPGFPAAGHDATRVSDFSACDPTTLHGLMVKPGVSSFVRDVEYLDWRYARHPDHSYHMHFVDEGAGGSGLIVFRETETYGRRMVLILEWWASSGAHAARMLRAATDYCRREAVRYIVTVSNTLGIPAGLRFQLIRVPAFVSPKRQILWGVPRGEVAERIFARPWSLQMGDLLEF
jgi:GNAT superfamily N-acetyltransferase